MQQNISKKTNQFFTSKLDASIIEELMYYKFGTIKLLGTVKFTFFSTSLSESLPEELEETSSFDLGILKEKCIT